MSVNKSLMGAAVAALTVLVSGCLSTGITGGPLPATGLTDGVYRGTATDGPVKAVVEVTLEQGAVTHIDLLHHRRWRGGSAEKEIPARIIRQQSTRVDAVSGATVSSRAIMNAVQDAVSKAGTGQ